jgi:hypothetical protein
MAKAATELLVSGRTYRVVRAFVDYDGEEHPVGETWVFRRHNFLPYESGLSLFVSPDGAVEWHIRLQWQPETQGPIIDNFDLHVRELPPAS